MVRVLSVHHFTREDVQNIRAEPLGVIITESNLCLIATSKSQIQVRDLDSSSSLLHQFSTLDSIISFVYSSVNSSIITLEEFGKVRVYVNWNNVHIDSYPLSLRIAGILPATCRSKNLSTSYFDVIEFPKLKDSLIRALNVCPSSGNIILLSDFQAFIHQIHFKKRGISSETILDYEALLQITLPFSPSEISFVENVISVLKSNAVLVFRVSIEENNKESSFSSIFSTKEKKKKEESVESSKESELSSLSKPISWNSFKRIEIPEIFKANSEYCNSQSHKILNTLLGPSIDSQVTFEQYEVTSYQVQICHLVSSTIFPKEEKNEKLGNLSLRAVYRKDFQMKNKDFCRLLESVHYSHLVNFSLSFTSNTECHLFYIPGFFSKKDEGVKVLSSINFTSSVRVTASEPFLFHALTDTGLETYTHPYPYSFLKEEKSFEEYDNYLNSDSEESSVTLVGLRPFFGAQFLSVGLQHLVLLSTNEYDTQWTLYSLSLPSPLQMYKELIEVATLNLTHSPIGSSQLLSEAHRILVVSINETFWRGETPSSELREFYADSCFQYASQSLKNSYRLSESLLYFRRGKLNLLTALEAIFDASPDTKEYTTRPIHHVRLLSDFISDYLSETTAPLKDSVRESIVILLGSREPELLARLFLSPLPLPQTSLLNSFFKEALEEKRKYKYKQSKPILFLALALLLSKDDEDEKKTKTTNNNSQISSYLSSLSSQDLKETLKDYKDLLIEKEGFSDLSLLLQYKAPSLFASVLVDLRVKSTFELEKMYNFYLRSVNMEKVLLSFEIYLEFYYMTLCHEKNRSTDIVHEPSLLTLIRFYCTALSSSECFLIDGERNTSENSEPFGPRHDYCSILPPFDDRNYKSDSRTSSLIKLQSLLCSSLVQTFFVSVANTIKGFLTHFPNSLGSLSLRLLVSERQEGVALCIDEAPKSLLAYSTQSIVSQEKINWRTLLITLNDNLALSHSSESQNYMEEQRREAIKDIYNYLAHNVSLDELLSLIPCTMRQENDVLEGIIAKAQKLQRAHQLQALIAKSATQILMTL